MHQLSADWSRHEWNCVPVMVTEFPGKGRGLVAARDIEKGELIFKDKQVIKLSANIEYFCGSRVYDFFEGAN